MTEIKSIQGWHDSNARTWEQYCKIGDICDESVYEYFLNIVPPLINTQNILQISEPYGTRIDHNGVYKNTYSTFKKYDVKKWIYCGNCFKGETFETGKPIPIVKL